MSELILNAFADESSPDISGQIDAMLRNGVKGLEIRRVNGKGVTEWSLDELKEIRKQLEDNDLNVWSIGSALGKINVTDDFGPHLDQFKYCLDVAHTLGANYIRLFSFYMPKDADPTPYKEEVFERLNAFVEASKDSGVKLCHENEKGIYGDIASRCLEIHKAFPTIGCIFDPANYIQCGQDTMEAWNMLESYVTYMHIKDALPDGKVVPAGKGAGNLPEILKRYKANGGVGVTLEPHLSIFKGLEALEREGEKSVVGAFQYPSKEAAFDAAVAALKEII